MLPRQTTEELIAKCKAMVDAEEAAQFEEGYINEADPSGGRSPDLDMLV